MKARRKLGVTKLTMCYYINETHLKFFSNLARKTYFSSLIKDNSKSLFSIISGLINHVPHAPYKFFSNEKCDSFAEFFTSKITSIRDNTENDHPCTITLSALNGADNTKSAY